MKKIRIGIIGMGGMGCRYASMLMRGELPRMELTAVTKPGRHQTEWEGRGMLEEQMVPVFENADALLEYPELDAVIISTPHYSHEEYCIKAMRHGLHVMCEKPSAAHVLQAQRMNEEAEKHSTVFAMMFNQRTLPVYRTIYELVHGGEFGPLRRVNWISTNWYRNQEYFESNEWRARWATEGGGVMLNQAVHNLDMLQWLCGMPVKIRAFCEEGKWHSIEVEDEVTAFMEFENGATGTFVTSTGYYNGNDRLQIDLENARIVAEEGKIRIFGSQDKKNRYEKEILPEQGSDPYHVMLNNFADAVLEGKPLIADGREGINSLMLCNGAYLSSWKEKTLKLPLDGEEYYEELTKRYR